MTPVHVLNEPVMMKGPSVSDISTLYDTNVAGVFGVSHDCQFQPGHPGDEYPGPIPGTPGPYHANGAATEDDTGLSNSMLIDTLLPMMAK